MNEGGYKIRNQAAVHFITFATVQWIDVFTRKDYRDIIFVVTESSTNLQKKKTVARGLHSGGQVLSVTPR